MLRFARLSLIARSLLLVPALAPAEEGKVAEPTVAPEPDRVANYSRGAAASSARQRPKQAMRHVQAKASAAAVRTKRGAPIMSSHAGAGAFYIYDAVSTLRLDRDGDGYHSEFRVRFDADSRVGDALVYARLYLRRAGEREWYLYHETDDFWIYGQSGSDDYYVTTTLDAGYPTGEYDVLIDLYESGYSGIVATLGPLDSGALSYLPLEEVGLDVPIEIPGYSIGEVFTDLIVDDDADGHYSRFQITFDPDADYERRLVFARVWVRARGDEWIEEFVTEDWWVETSGGSDAYVLDIDWISGYPTSYYDVQIDLYDAATERLIASAGSDRPDLAQLPLEDRTRDRKASPPPPPGGGGVSHSREGGGGALGGSFLAALLILAGAARRRMA
jgi:hypothetical protein